MENPYETFVFFYYFDLLPEYCDYDVRKEVKY